ncbi:MAG: mechanosensitive ion channel [Chlamydiia bacterium]|nr:mechanosensitive ion channel [Chlamydiia bacterium]
MLLNFPFDTSILNNDKISSLLSNIKSVGFIKILLMILITIIILSVVFSIKEHLKKSLEKTLGKYYKNSDDDYSDTIPAVYIFDKFITYSAIALCCLISARFLGVKMGDLTILVGAASVVIALGLQEFLKNFISGIIILMENNIRIGDILDISNIKSMNSSQTNLAWVSEIRTRTLVLTTLDGREVIIPNVEMVNNSITNITLSNPLRRIHFPFYLPTSINFEEIKEKVIAEISKHPICSKQPATPSVWIKSIAPGFMQCDLVIWINQKRVKTSPTSLIGAMLIKILQENNALVSMESSFNINAQHTYETGF